MLLTLIPSASYLIVLLVANEFIVGQLSFHLECRAKASRTSTNMDDLQLPRLRVPLIDQAIG